jgi:hypothetical protein
LWDPPTQVSDSLRITFNGLEGRRYAVESAVGLSGPFTPLAEMMGQAGGTVLFDPITSTNRFYRARPLP